MALDLSKLSPKGRRGMAVFYCAIGIVFGGWCLRTIWMAHASAGWPKTSGQVVASELETKHSLRRGTSEGVSIRYAYEVKGRRYENDLVAYGASNERWLSQAWLDRYEEDAPITVYYDPADPARSVLEHVFPLWPWLMVGLGTLFVGIGVRTFRAASRELRGETGAPDGDEDAPPPTARRQPRRPRDSEPPAD